jgi:hypothetical protein
MVMCGSNMFKFSVSKDMTKRGYNKGGGSREGTGTFMSNIDCQELKIGVEDGRVVTTRNIIIH